MTDLDELRAELNDFAQTTKRGSRSALEDRVIAGFEEIQRFVEKNGRVPRSVEGASTVERIYGIRLERLRQQQEYRAILAPIDSQVLLGDAQLNSSQDIGEMNDDVLMAELESINYQVDIGELRHVRTYAEKRAAEEVETRERCEDFERYETIFHTVRAELKSGVRSTRTFQTEAKAMDSVQEKSLFILNGQIAYIAELGEAFTTQYERRDSRLRVIFDNGTESKILLRSFQRALHRDEAARVIVDSDIGPLFENQWDDRDVESGTIYVLRSHSGHPFVQEHRELIHKIGVTRGRVEDRVAGAARHATYLLADVEVVACYKLSGINCMKLEGIFHRVFSEAQLDLTIHDRFGQPVRPKEWFLVPLHVIDEVVQRITDGSITGVVYDPSSASLKTA
ncbi:GIY-YIG nuclease family protein [Oxalobacteraceae sp. CFBP 8753]|nr:GIY-YIG nuclease family protein [Oxalobacteraceae sp. CFBP 8753]